jgi:protein PhnA
MKLNDLIKERSNGKCEMCTIETALQVYEVPPQDQANEANSILICSKCAAQVNKKEALEAAHWKVLGETMWSEVPGVQVMAWRMLNRLRNESWSADNLDLLYLDDEKLTWAKATGDHENDGSVALHKDSNGAILSNGDSIVLTRSLDVKGSTLNAKMGTVVKNIRLVPDNFEQIEGKIEGQLIVILTKYVRKHA